MERNTFLCIYIWLSCPAFVGKFNETQKNTFYTLTISFVLFLVTFDEQKNTSVYRNEFFGFKASWVSVYTHVSVFLISATIWCLIFFMGIQFILYTTFIQRRTWCEPYIIIWIQSSDTDNLLIRPPKVRYKTV